MLEKWTKQSFGDNGTSSGQFLQENKLWFPLPIDVYGKCGTFECPGDSIDCFLHLADQYKFYIAFENR